jgi:transcriptional regulator with XRE-family HTH domain
VQVIAPQLAERLSAAIRNSKYSAREVADLSGVDKGTISEWTRADERVDRGVQVERVERVARVLGTSAEQLLDLPEPADAQANAPTPIESRAPPVRTAVAISVSNEKVRRMQELIVELAALAQDAIGDGSAQ